MNKDDTPYTCFTCGQSNKPDELFAGSCCPECYTIIVEPLTRAELKELIDHFAQRILNLEARPSRSEQLTSPPLNIEAWEGLDKWQTIAIKWQFHMLSGYFSLLMQQIAKADADNIERLRLGFPDHVKAYELYYSKPEWWNTTLAIAKQKGYVKEVKP